MSLQNNNILAGSYVGYAASQVSSLVYVEAIRVLSAVDNALRSVLSASNYTYIKNGDFNLINNSFVQNITSIFSGAREYINGSRSLTSFVNITISSLGISNIINVTINFVTTLVEQLNSFFSGANKAPENTFVSPIVVDTPPSAIPPNGERNIIPPDSYGPIKDETIVINPRFKDNYFYREVER